jgi:hypothetical protein
VSKYILHAAVAQGGVVRAFDQGSNTVTCAIYSSDWLIGRMLGDDRVFARSSRTGKQLQRMVDVTEMPLVRTDDYVINEFPDASKIQVITTDYQPAADYAKNATETKNAWGNMGLTITPKAQERVREAIKPSTLVLGKDDILLFYPGQDQAELLACLEKPGYFFGNVQSSSGHAIATHVTAESFTLFDPLVGELTIPRARLTAWLAHDFVRKEYFEKANGASFTPYGVT